jgi:hypothetical protein
VNSDTETFAQVGQLTRAVLGAEARVKKLLKKSIRATDNSLDAIISDQSGRRQRLDNSALEWWNAEANRENSPINPGDIATALHNAGSRRNQARNVLALFKLPCVATAPRAAILGTCPADGRWMAASKAKTTMGSRHRPGFVN